MPPQQTTPQGTAPVSAASPARLVLISGMSGSGKSIALHALEDAHGRDRSGPRFNDRTLDIDIVFYDDLVMQGTGNLRIPRDELRHAFVLKPLADIAPDFVDPTSGKALATLWKAHPEHGRELEVVALD